MATRDERLMRHADRMFDAICALEGSSTFPDIEDRLAFAVAAARAYDVAMGDTEAEAGDDALPARTDSNWISTFTGKKFWPLNPVREFIDIRDIAHGLSNICRFTGQCRHFYSVAQHCVLASEWCHPDDARWCLMHDASEAYLLDIPKPVKAYLPVMRYAEQALLKMMAAEFNLPWPIPFAVHEADSRILATERRDVMGLTPVRILPQERREPFPDTIEPVPPLTAEAMFLTRFGELFGWDY